MSPVDYSILERKIARIIENLREIKRIHHRGWNEYHSNLIVRKATEKLIQEMIEAASDINVQVLVGTGREPPPDYRSGFVELGEMKVIPRRLAGKLLPAAGLRNRIVHGYEKLDNRIIFDSIPLFQTHFPAYLRAIRKWMKRK